MAKLRLKDCQLEISKWKGKCSDLEVLSCDLKYKLANALIDADEYSVVGDPNKLNKTESPAAVVTRKGLNQQPNRQKSFFDRIGLGSG
jgi:hypothetical protein